MLPSPSSRWRDFVLCLYNKNRYVEVSVFDTTVFVEWGAVTWSSWEEKPALQRDDGYYEECTTLEEAFACADEVYFRQKGHEGTHWPAVWFTRKTETSTS
jgi:hypothetical protein